MIWFRPFLFLLLDYFIIINNDNTKNTIFNTDIDVVRIASINFDKTITVNSKLVQSNCINRKTKKKKF